jgi:hypothetical protein
VTNNWQDVINFFRFFTNQRVALFGNAKSVLLTEKEIDAKYDIICRMNSGFPKGKEQYIGTRTDILFLSTPLTEEEIKIYNPIYLIWCTPKHEKMTEYIKANALIYPESDWQILHDKLGHRPSTGMMAINILLNMSSLWTSLSLYGFDHWKTETWYTNRIAPCHHNPEAEKQYLEEIMSNFNGRIIKI